MMASNVLLLLLLLAAVSTPASAYDYYRYFGGTLTVSLKGSPSTDTYVVELRNKQATVFCTINPYTCLHGNCGSQIQSIASKIAWESYGLNWCQKEIKTKVQLPSNQPFEIRYPTNINYYHGNWISNVRGSKIPYRMMAHVDLGTRSDTGRANRLPVSTMLPIVRVTRNCPRTFDFKVFDPDGDRVRCRVPTSPHTYECNPCGLTQDLSVDEESCTVTYGGGNGRYGYHPVELVVEDFPSEEITLFYSDGSRIVKEAFAGVRRKRQVFMTTTDTTVALTTSTSTLPGTVGVQATTVQDQTTTIPVQNQMTTIPVQDQTTTIPVQDQTTTIPVQDQTTTIPVQNQMTTIPVQDQTTTIPVQDQTTTIPVQDQTTTIPVQDQTTTIPVQDQTTTIPVQDQTTTIPVQDQTTTIPVQNQMTTIPVQDQTTTIPVQDQTTTIPVRDQTTIPPTTPAGPTTAASTASLYRHSLPSLSKLPLQFSVLVDWHSAPSCSEGDYFPMFLAPTPANGAHIPAFVDRTLEITVRSSAQYSSIVRLLLTGPSGIYQERISTGSYIIKWTPTPAELDDHFPICFLSEGLYRYQVYHSELRCVTINVAHHEAVVTCSETAIKVEVEKDDLIRLHEHYLHLNKITNSPTCNLKRLSNNTHLVAIMPLNGCGTYVEEDKENIIFRNQITSADPNTVISRHNDVDIAFYCVYPRRSNLTLGFRHKNPYAFKEKGFGSFTFQFEFFEGPQFRQQVDGSTYPVEVYLKQMIYMQIEATSSIPNTELFVESCRATPYDKPESSISYSIIENGCVKDNTVQVYNGSKSQFRFGMEAFEFIGAHNEVYITCSVLLCESGAPNTRCLQACVPTGSHRSKREAAAQTSSHFVSQGPLHLVKMSESPDVDTVQAEIKASVPGLNLSMNLVFIVGCLLACGVVVYRSRRSRAKYQLLPTSETD